MSTAKFTPGPWATDSDAPTFDGADLPYTVYINYGSGKGGEICTMLHEPNEGRGRDWEEGKANARLIAAAPELLEALEVTESAMFDLWNDLKSYGDKSRFEQFDAVARKASKAISKAKGDAK